MRKGTTTLAICLILGVVINYAVAWSMAIGQSITTSRRVCEQRVVAVLARTVEPRACVEPSPESIPSPPQRPFTVRQGWPFRSLAYTRPHPIEVFMPGQSVRAPTLERGIVVPELDGLLARVSFSRLALRPHLPGFLINTIVYACLAYVFVLALSRLRRTWRFRR